MAQPAYDGGSLESLTAAADDSVKGALSTAQGLRDFLANMDLLTQNERHAIVDQAILLLEGFYVHLPLKRAMHAVDPLQRLRLLKRRLPQIRSEVAFHHEMTDIFTSVRDLHTNYILPAYFAGMVAYLPFRVQACHENGKREYIVSKVAAGFDHPTFKPGVEIRYWNGIPIERAIEIAANYHAGSNPEARRARGIEGLTKRAMIMTPPPDEEWVVVRYEHAENQQDEFRVDWIIGPLPRELDSDIVDTSVAAAAAEGVEGAQVPAPEAAALGLDLEGDTFRRINKMLFAQDVLAAKRRIEEARNAAMATTESLGPQSLEAVAEIVASAAVDAVAGLESTMPDTFAARVIEVGGKSYAYVRIHTFMKSDILLVNEFLRLIQLREMPKDGLIIDLRGNGGGSIRAGERLLQLLTPRTIEPTRFQFINTPGTLEICKGVPWLAEWHRSIARALESGATFSAAFPLTAPDRCNDIGQRYYGPVVLITDARCYSTTDIFAAGFQDHRIGKIIGTDQNTGAGGANVWDLNYLRQVLTENGIQSPIRPLPKGAGMRVAIRRTLRVGPEAGTELEDFGVVPDFSHKVTRNDVLNDNVDLKARAAQILSEMQPVYGFDVSASRADQQVRIDVATRNVEYIEALIQNRFQSSHDVANDAAQLTLTANTEQKIELRGYGAGALVCCRQLRL